jgi:hypothetical protein
MNEADTVHHLSHDSNTMGLVTVGSHALHYIGTSGLRRYQMMAYHLDFQYLLFIICVCVYIPNGRAENEGADSSD